MKRRRDQAPSCAVPIPSKDAMKDTSSALPPKDKEVMRDKLGFWRTSGKKKLMMAVLQGVVLVSSCRYFAEAEPLVAPKVSTSTTSVVPQ